MLQIIQCQLNRNNPPSKMEQNYCNFHMILLTWDYNVTFVFFKLTTFI